MPLNPNISFLRAPTGALVSLFLLSVFALGLWARFHDLGASALAVDEYYLLESANNVLRTGLPHFEDGGYYTRGILHQYIAAGLKLIGFTPEVAIRLPAVLAGLLVIWGSYALARHIGGWKLALLISGIACVSLWQVEFARFGRMYSMFGACTLFYVLCAIKYLQFGLARHYRQMLMLGSLAIVIYEGASLLLAFTVAAAFIAPRRPTTGEFTAAVTTLIIGVLAIGVDWRFLGVSDPYGSELSALLRSIHEQGQVHGVGSPPWLNIFSAPRALLALSAALAATILWYKTWTKSGILDRRAFVDLTTWIVTFSCVALGLSLLGILVFLCGAFFGLVHPQWYSKPKRLLTLVSIIVLCYGLSLTTFFMQNTGASWQDALNYLESGLRFPELYERVVVPWAGVLPVLLIFMALLSALGAVASFYCQTLSEDEVIRYRFLCGITLALLVGATLAPQPYYITRYTYFLYPLFLIASAQGTLFTIKWFVPGLRFAATVSFAIVSAVFLSSNDFSLRHLLSISDPQFLYRTVYDDRMQEHLYQRWDYRGIAQKLNTLAKNGDLVATTVYPGVQFYSRRFDFNYIDPSSDELVIVSANHGTRDLWSKLPLVFDPVELHRRIETSAHTVWLVMHSDRYRWRTPIEIELLSRYRNDVVYTSQDRNLVLLRIAR